MVSLPSTYKGAVAKSKDSPLEIQDKPLRHPGAGQVLVKVIACGVCWSDHAIASGMMGDVFPRVPGHEIVGDIVEIGEGVTRFSVGQRVGGPWHGGHDGTCKSCQKAMYQTCESAAVNGCTHDGGFAQYVLLRTEAVVRVPGDMDPAQVAPLLCAGVTVFNGIRKLHAEQGGVLAVQGVGGLGHMAVQFGNKMGYHVVAISSGDSKRDFAKKLGAMAYIDASKEDPAKKLQEMGGASIIVATAPNPKSISPLVGGLGVGGKLLVLAPAGPVEFDTMKLVSKASSVHGWPSGHALDSEEAIEFAREKGVECMVEKFKLEEAEKAMQHMLSGKARFRCVLTME